MSFVYTPFPSDPREDRWHRVLCYLPWVESWLVLLTMTAAVLLVPSVGAALIIAFLLYFIVRIAYNGLFLALSFIRVFAEEQSDWMQRLDDLAQLSAARARRRPLRLPPRRPERRRVARIHAQVLESCLERGEELPDPRDLLHVVIIPVSSESRAVYEPGIRALADGTMDPRRHLLVVLSVEERSGQAALEAAADVRRTYRRSFRDFIVHVHPPGLPGEVPGKGSNVGHAARHVQGWLRRRRIDPANVLLTCIDADAVVSRQYFACLSYYFLAEPDRIRSCFQPLPVFSNNIWKTNALVRVVEMSQTALQLIDSTNVEMLVTFSCYSYSFAALAESGFWPPDVIGEDAAVFWKTFLHFRGAFKAIPLPVTVTMDAAEGTTIVGTLRSAYKQKMRWAYGVENQAIVFRGLFRHGLVRGRRRWQATLKFLDTTFQTTWPFILSVLIWLPQGIRLVTHVDPLPVFNLGRISSLIFQLSGVFLAMLIVVTGFYALRGSRGVPFWKKLLYPLEWYVVLPVATILLGGLPAIHAQGKLAFGRRLVYVPMEKLRPGPGAQK